MQTLVLPVDPQAPEAAPIHRQADVLRRGGLIAFPTETVYGLGANAVDPGAIQRIFDAKGRPATNPLIVHVADIAAARTLVTDWPASAQTLAAHFWPGPLTLVLPRSERVPLIVTAGGPTVAIRVPAHPVALALLRAAELPLAAPSANRSTKLSPTRAEHVLRDLGGRIDLVLDAGPTFAGLESTVLDLTSSRPRLLRPGPIAPHDLETVIGPMQTDTIATRQEPVRSPGMDGRHYAPTTPLEISADDARRVQELGRQRQRIGWLTFSTPDTDPSIVPIIMPTTAAQYAARLYDVLHQLDAMSLDRIVVALPPEGGEWLAIHDRLRRAAAMGE